MSHSCENTFTLLYSYNHHRITHILQCFSASCLKSLAFCFSWLSHGLLVLWFFFLFCILRNTLHSWPCNIFVEATCKSILFLSFERQVFCPSLRHHFWLHLLLFLALTAVRDKRAKNMGLYSSQCTTSKWFYDDNIMNLLTEDIKFMHCVYQDNTGNFCLQCRSGSDFRRGLHFLYTLLK